jgi:hypothetical protein
MRLLFNNALIGTVNATRIVPSRTLLRNKADLGYGFRWTVEVDSYLVLSDNNADTTLKMLALEIVLAAPSGNLQFQYDNNTDTPHSWFTANTFTGVRCTDLTWTGEPGAQFRTWRSFRCRFEWEELFSQSAGFLLDFTETIRIRGGVPQFVTNEFINNVAPLSLVTVVQSKWTATQVGRAVGLTQYPVPALFPPLWGAGSPPLKDRDFERVSPERKGNPARYRGFEVRWNYSFESAGSLELNPLGGLALPALWT